MYNTETRIVEESIHVRFNDRLDPEKSKLVEKFADLEISYSEPKEKPEEIKESESPASEPDVDPSEPAQQKENQTSNSTS